MTTAASPVALDPAGLDQRSFAALAQFRRQVRAFFAASEAMLQAGALPSLHYQALLAVKAGAAEERYTLGALARDLVIKLNSAVELADRIAAAGLIDRRRDPADRRCVLIALTPAGEAALDHFARLHLAEHRRLLPGLLTTVRDLQRVLD